MPRAAVIRGARETVWAIRELRQLAEPIVGALAIRWAGEAQTGGPHMLHTVQTYARCHSCYVEYIYQQVVQPVTEELGQKNSRQELWRSCFSSQKHTWYLICCKECGNVKGMSIRNGRFCHAVQQVIIHKAARGLLQSLVVMFWFPQQENQRSAF